MIYRVNVEFNSETFVIDKNKVTIGVKSRPVRGEANKEVIKKLAKYFGVSSQLVIKSGIKSNNKIIELLT